MMHCLTYGTLPDREVFDRAFTRECPTGVYHTSDHGDLTADDAWKLVSDGVNRFEATGDTCETDFAGALLYTLGIEWV